jgi:hypothetical protein
MHVMTRTRDLLCRSQVFCHHTTPLGDKLGTTELQMLDKIKEFQNFGCPRLLQKVHVLIFFLKNQLNPFGCKTSISNPYFFCIFMTYLSATINYLFSYYLFICQFFQSYLYKTKYKGCFRKAFWTF